MKYISLLGSTGSIGTQTLDVIKNNKETFQVCGLTGNSNIDLLEKQTIEFKPKIVAINNEKYYKELKKRVGSISEVVCGPEGIMQVATMDETNFVMSAIVGIAGLKPTYAAIKNGKTIGLANKETLVAAGAMIMDAAKKYNSTIIPVDSEHSAIYQCLSGNSHKLISKLILTASGGPFREKSADELKTVTLEQTLKHPNWSMGRKISVDSATLMNKGLEFIEAKWLFDVSHDKIEICVHPQSIIHSMVEFIDGTIIAQMGIPDMRIPIQYSLTYPERNNTNTEGLDLFKVGTLTFEKPKYELFRCLLLAINAIKANDNSSIVLNAANEIAVGLFLNKVIGFTQISEIIEKTLQEYIPAKVENMDDILAIDAWARKRSSEFVK